MSTNSERRRTGPRPDATRGALRARPAVRLTAPPAVSPAGGPARSGRKAVAVLASIGSAAAIAGAGITALTAMGLAQVSAQPGQGQTQTATLTAAGVPPSSAPTGTIISPPPNPLSSLFLSVPTSFPGSAAANSPTGTSDLTGFPAANGGSTLPNSLFPSLAPVSTNVPGLGGQVTFGAPFSTDGSLGPFSSAFGFTAAAPPGKDGELGGSSTVFFSPTEIANALNGGPVSTTSQAQTNITNYANAVNAQGGLPFSETGQTASGLTSGINNANMNALNQSVNGDSGVGNLFNQFAATTAQQNASSVAAGLQNPSILGPNEQIFIGVPDSAPQTSPIFTAGQVLPGGQVLSDTQLLNSGQAANGGPLSYATIGQGFSPLTLSSASGSTGGTNPFAGFTTSGQFVDGNSNVGGGLQDLINNSLNNTRNSIDDNAANGIGAGTGTGSASGGSLNGLGLENVQNNVGGNAVNSSGGISADDLKVAAAVNDAQTNSGTGTGTSTSDDGTAPPAAAAAPASGGGFVNSGYAFDDGDD